MPFCLVSDDAGSNIENVGFVDVNMHDIYEDGDMVDRKVEVLDKNDRPIATLIISIIAQQALHSVLSEF